MTLARAATAALAAPLLLAGLSGCVHHHDGTASTEVRASEPAGFARIDVRGPVDVLVREGAGTQVAVTGGASERAKVKTHVEGDTLVIESSSADDDEDDDGDGDACDH